MQASFKEKARASATCHSHLIARMQKGNYLSGINFVHREAQSLPSTYLVVPLQEGILIHAHIAVLDGQLLHEPLSFPDLLLAGLWEACAHQILVHLWRPYVIRKAQVQHVHAWRGELHSHMKLS